MRISVIIPTYNRQGFLRQALDSFLSQDYEDKELVVINDGGSEDDNIYLELKNNHTYFYRDHSTQSETQNYGIENSTGELICTLDDDDLFYDSSSLSERVKAFDKDTEVIWTGAQDIWENGSHKEYHPVIIEQDIWRKDQIFINSMMWRRSIKDKIGYWFDPELTSNEDWDFKIRCLNECKCKPLDFFSVKHRVHPSMRSTAHRGTGELSKNEGIFRKKLKKYEN